MSWSNKARRRMDVVGCKAAVLTLGLWGKRRYMWVIGVCMCCWVWVMQMNFRVYRAYRVEDTKKGVSMGGFRVVGMGPCG